MSAKYIFEMSFLNSVFPKPVIPAFWFILAVFFTLIFLYRPLAKQYKYSAIFALGSGLVYTCLFMPESIFPYQYAVFVLGVGIHRPVFVFVSARICNKAMPKLYKALFLVSGILVAIAALVLALIKTGLLESNYSFFEGVAFILVAIQSVAVLLALWLLYPKNHERQWLIWAAIPWAAVWLLIAAERVFAFDWIGKQLFFAGFWQIYASAGDALLGMGLLLAVMLELARPAREDHAIDELANKLGASIKPFVPSEILEHLNKGSFSELKLGDHIKKDMTIFFSDIRSFTAMSESLTPEESFAFINSYLSRVVPVIDEYGGFIDKYMGDGIMALFAEEGGADSAVSSGVAIQTKMVEYNGHRAKVNYKPISMGIGIHTGTLMLGVVGVPGRMEGTVISDAVNLSSRLQSIAKAFNIPLVISESTFMQLLDPGKYKYRFIGKVKVKGKDAPVSVFEIFDGLPEEIFERKMKSNTFFEQGMMAYYQKDYAQALFYFNRALEIVPEDGASKFYLETCLRKTMAAKTSH